MEDIKYLNQKRNIMRHAIGAPSMGNEISQYSISKLANAWIVSMFVADAGNFMDKLSTAIPALMKIMKVQNKDPLLAELQGEDQEMTAEERIHYRDAVIAMKGQNFDICFFTFKEVCEFLTWWEEEKDKAQEEK